MCPKSPALLGTSLLGKDEVHEFDSRHQLHLKPPSFIDNEGGFAIYCWVFEGLSESG